MFPASWKYVLTLPDILSISINIASGLVSGLRLPQRDQEIKDDSVSYYITHILCILTWSEQFWGGAPLREDIGRFLYEESVGIHIVYGATEFGSVTVMSGNNINIGSRAMACFSSIYVLTLKFSETISRRV